MKASTELKWLQEKLESGDMHPDEPLFILRGRDVFAAETVLRWAATAASADNPPPEGKIREAMALSGEMQLWPVKQIPGKPETRVGEMPDAPPDE